MKMKTTVQLPAQTVYAAQNAQQGLINVLDLSLLTGVEVGMLSKFAKTGTMAHYGEYHGKRFFNFQELVKWLHGNDGHTEAKPVIREKMDALLQKKTCPYLLEKTNGDVRIIWKDCVEAEAA
jgi:hypothetical protein